MIISKKRILYSLKPRSHISVIFLSKAPRSHISGYQPNWRKHMILVYLTVLFNSPKVENVARVHTISAPHRPFRTATGVYIFRTQAALPLYIFHSFMLSLLPLSEQHNRRQKNRTERVRSMSEVMEFASSQEGHEESENERLEMIHNMDDPTAGSLSLSSWEIFLRAAVSLKDKVRDLRGMGVG